MSNMVSPTLKESANEDRRRQVVVFSVLLAFGSLAVSGAPSSCNDHF